MTKSLKDDRPVRKRFKAISPQIKPMDRTPGVNPVLITSAMFFTQRDRDMAPKKVFAEKVYRGLLEKCSGRTVIVCVSETYDWMRPHLLENYSTELKDSGVDLRVFAVKDTDPRDTTVRLWATLQDMGVNFRPARNPRSISYLNIGKFVRSGIEIVCADGYADLGLEPEKELTFQDMVAKRKRNAWP